MDKVASSIFDERRESAAAGGQDFIGVFSHCELHVGKASATISMRNSLNLSVIHKSVLCYCHRHLKGRNLDLTCLDGTYKKGAHTEVPFLLIQTEIVHVK